jgi:hypothetical protein
MAGNAIDSCHTLVFSILPFRITSLLQRKIIKYDEFWHTLASDPKYLSQNVHKPSMCLPKSHFRLYSYWQGPLGFPQKKKIENGDTLTKATQSFPGHPTARIILQFIVSLGTESITVDGPVPPPILRKTSPSCDTKLIIIKGVPLKLKC